MPLPTKQTLFVLTAIALAATAGCRGDRSNKPPRQFFPDMDDQPRWNAQGQSGFFEDGRTQRPNVPGTVAFGRWDTVQASPETMYRIQSRTDTLRDNDAIYKGIDANGNFLERNPLPITAELLARGQNRFNIYCIACHGRKGDGKGAVGSRWDYDLPTFHDASKYAYGAEKGADGYIWSTALNGVFDVTGTQKMPGYSYALSEHDAWAVVAYIRALQASQNATIDDVGSEADRIELERSRPDAIRDQAASTQGATP